MKDTKICVIGLGYVGLPLARLFATKFQTIGFDMNQARVDALMGGHDATLEVEDELLQDAIKNHGFRCTTDLDAIRNCNFYVVAVPTPVDSDNRPDLKPLWGASETVGKVISKGDVVADMRDVLAIEHTAAYNGLYHVLGGVISPIEGIAPSDLHIEDLVERTRHEDIREIILALPATIEGDTTNFYIYRQLKDFKGKITVIAKGIAVGDTLEYVDEITLGRSIQNRVTFN